MESELFHEERTQGVTILRDWRLFYEDMYFSHIKLNILLNFISEMGIINYKIIIYQYSLIIYKINFLDCLHLIFYYFNTLERSIKISDPLFEISDQLSRHKKLIPRHSQYLPF